MKKEQKPWSFGASEKLFTVALDKPCVISGFSVGERYACFRKPILVKKGDKFCVVDGKVVLNGQVLERAHTPLKRRPIRVSWVANKLRVVVFLERDCVWSKKLKRHTKKLGNPYWVAYDVRSYHIGTGDTAVQAVNALIRQCQVTNLMAEEEKVTGGKVIRWRCLLPAAEVKEAEEKAKKTGFILDGVTLPPWPKRWDAGLERLKKSGKGLKWKALS